MANASTAPLKKENKYEKEEAALNMQFDPQRRYVFELAEENIPRELPVWDFRENKPLPPQKHKPYRNIILTSQIIWKGQRRMARYYDGCDSIFVDEQPKDKDIMEQFINQTAKRNFVHGKFSCYGDERMLLLYLFICSWNANSPFKTRSSDTVFVFSDPGKKLSAESAKLDLIDQARDYVKGAPEKKMLIHAKYLGIPEEDEESGNPLTTADIRVLYRKKAIESPQLFIDSYNNKALEVQYYIGKALAEGIIDVKSNPNQAAWKNNHALICDISGLRSLDAIGEKLLEFSQLEEGEEFSIQLKALYD